MDEDLENNIGETQGEEKRFLYVPDVAQLPWLILGLVLAALGIFGTFGCGFWGMIPGIIGVWVISFNTTPKTESKQYAAFRAVLISILFAAAYFFAAFGNDSNLCSEVFKWFSM